ncbi:MAG: AmmeMemoRadiSam system protein B [Candidatus Woesearchaeota archaeon]
MRRKNSRRLEVWHIIVFVSALIAFGVIFALHTNRSIQINDKNQNANETIVVREAAVAGRFYPSSKDELKKVVQTYITQASPEPVDNVKGIVVPHAGYIYSGLTAGYAYNLIQGQEYNTIIILGPSHTAAFYGASVVNATHFSTPLGLVRLSSKAKQLMSEPLFSYQPAAHIKEHSIEVQLPFLQTALGEFEIIPITIGYVDPTKLGDVLLKYIDDNTLVIASSDLSHYHPYEEARRLDQACINAVPAIDFENFQKCEACGYLPVATLMYIAKKQGWKGKLLDYRTSGDTAGAKDSVVGYMSAVFYIEEGLSERDQKLLLELARQTLEHYLQDSSMPIVDEDMLSGALKKKQGCFVTLEKNGHLRGCIGHIVPQEKLYRCVIENAINAALNDPRFPVVKYNELKDIEIEISVLTVPQEVKFSSGEELLGKLRPGIDGVIVGSGMRQGTFLPQVWDTFNNDKEAFLSELCYQKAGLSRDCWKDTKTKVSTYQAQVFRE